MVTTGKIHFRVRIFSADRPSPLHERAFQIEKHRAIVKFIIPKKNPTTILRSLSEDTNEIIKFRQHTTFENSFDCYDRAHLHQLAHVWITREREMSTVGIVSFELCCFRPPPSRLYYYSTLLRTVFLFFYAKTTVLCFFFFFKNAYRVFV